MEDTFWSTRAVVCAALAVVSAGVVLGCSSKSTEPEDGGEVSVISPAVTVQDAQSYQVESAHVGRSRSGSSYVRGVVKIRYLGSADLRSVHVDATFRDKKNKTVFEDADYIANPHLCSFLSGTNSNSFLTPEHDIGYYAFITDLSDHNADISDIATLHLTLAGSSFTYAPPEGHLRLDGAACRVGTDDWRQALTNDGDVAVEQGFSLFIFADAQARAYHWVYADCYVGDSETDVFPVGATGRLVAEGVTPDYVAAPLTCAAVLVDWDPVAAGKPAATGSLPRCGLSLEESLERIRAKRFRVEQARSMMQ